MTDQNPPVQPPVQLSKPPSPAYAAPAPPPPPPTWAAPVPVAPGAMAGYDGPVGTIRSTGTCFLLTIVTLGIYSLYWFYKTHSEMRRHTGQGLDGAIALLLGLLISIVMYFVTPNEVGSMYKRKGMPEPVSAATGLWALLLGWFFGVGLIVWFVKTNGALNAYWRTQGAQG